MIHVSTAGPVSLLYRFCWAHKLSAVFQALANDFAEPRKEQIIGTNLRSDNPFWNIFDDIWEALESSKGGSSVQNQLVRIASQFMRIAHIEDL